MPARPPRRSGLRIRGHRAPPAVRRAVIEFGRWLRREIEFPVRVPVYLLAGEQVRTCDGRLCSASMFAPWDRREEPYIRMATGDWRELVRARGRRDALIAYLYSLAHEVVHYRQWIETGEMWERGVIVRSRHLVHCYLDQRHAARRAGSDPEGSAWVEQRMLPRGSPKLLVRRRRVRPDPNRRAAPMR